MMAKRNRSHFLQKPSSRFFAWLSDDHLAQVATDWAAEFNYQQPIIHTPAYKALHELRDLASHAIIRELSIVMYLFGSSQF